MAEEAHPAGLPAPEPAVEAGRPVRRRRVQAGVVAVALVAVEAPPGALLPQPAQRLGVGGGRRGRVPRHVRRGGRRAGPRALVLLPLLRLPPLILLFLLPLAPLLGRRVAKMPSFSLFFSSSIVDFAVNYLPTKMKIRNVNRPLISLIFRVVGCCDARNCVLGDWTQ